MPNRQYLYGDAYYYDGQFFYYAATETRVPNAESMIDENDGSLQMNAPELLVHNMFDIKKLAKWLNIEPTSIPPMLSRDQIVAPQFTVGSSPLWSRQVIEFWRQGRPGKGANLRADAQTPDPQPLQAPVPANFDSGQAIVPPGTPENVLLNPQPQPEGDKGNVAVDEAELLAQIEREEKAEKEASEAKAKAEAKLKAEAEAEVAEERRAKAEAERKAKAAANAK